MATTADVFDHDLFLEMVEAKMVRTQPHPRADLWILNYTSAAQFTYTWNDVTRSCRGLIVQGSPLLQPTSKLVARPFQKFFNLADHDEGGSHDALPLDRPFDVYGKMDGSLGILYEDPDGPAIATRGSFSSDQAQWATQYLRRNVGGRAVPAGVTLLFEIIYPANRIVVDYGDHEGLTFLAAIDIETGADVEVPDEWSDWLPRVQVYDGLNDVSQISRMIASSEPDWSNHEGFVLRFAPSRPGQPSPRVKAKFSEYVRLHRIITGISAKTIWEYLSQGRELNELLDHVPDEFYQWVQTTVESLNTEYKAIEAQCSAIMENPQAKVDNRRDVALYFQPMRHRAVLFKMLDGKPYGDLIWKAIKPQADQPFRDDPDI